MSVSLTVSDIPERKHTADLTNVKAREAEDESEENVREAELVVFDNTTQGLGLKIVGGCGANGKLHDGIYIRRILPGGLAEQQGGLEEGDLILEVNGHSMEGVTNEKALHILRQASASNHVEIVVTRDEEGRNGFEEVMVCYNEAVEHSSESGDQAKPLNCDFQGIHPHLASYYEHAVSLRADLPCSLGLDEDLHDHLSSKGGSSSQHSTVSSCNSELVHHMRDLPSPSSDASCEKRSSSEHGHQCLNSVSLNAMLSRSLPLALDSVNANCKFSVPKLEQTLQSLGFVISVEKHIELLKHIPVDSQGLTTFGEFVQAVRQVFSDELQAASNSTLSTPVLSPCLSPLQVNGYLTDAEGDNPIVEENKSLLQQIESLKEELGEQRRLSQKAEEQVLALRNESQAALEESRSLRTKLHLAEKSQEAARKMEQDYEQVVAMLENEISHLRLQLSKADGISEQRRLAVAACQLKKSETGKKTFEVATTKLLSHLQHVHDTLMSDLSHSRIFGEDKADRKKKRQKVLQSLVTEGQDVIRTIQTLIEHVPLPFGWEENYTAEGIRYYINHLNQTTSWTHPSSNVEHQSIAMATTTSDTARTTTVSLGVRPNNLAQNGL